MERCAAPCPARAHLLPFLFGVPSPPAQADVASAREAAMKPVKHCRHVKEDGIACGSPALRGENYCHFHLRYMQDKGEIAGPISRRPGF